MSNALSIVMASAAGKGAHSNEERWEYPVSFVREDAGPTLEDDDPGTVEVFLETGVLGGELRVKSWEPNDCAVC